ncbi:Transcription factor E [Candidatus Tiddalikarchaeum anstoanum]|nr:Transcription factor E [Candidatus Tiddalikarchaeum anstoanum]
MKDATKQTILETDPEVFGLVKSIIGNEGLHIIHHLLTVDKADEFEIAKSLKEDVNFVRSVMYKMYTHKLVSYTRRRDAEKGWYIYTWKLLPDRIYDRILNIKQKNMDRLYCQLEGEKNKEQGFHCKKCAIDLEFQKALELSFTCFACGGMLEPLNNNETIKKIDKDIDVLNNEIGLIRSKLNAQ